jgi:hypothetical protein
MWTLYSDSKTKNLIFDSKNIDRIRRLLVGYNYVQSLQVMAILPNLRTRIVQQNLPHDVEQLQCIFMESFCVAVLAVFDLSDLLEVNKLKAKGSKCECGIIQQLVGVKYKKSGRSFSSTKFCLKKIWATNKVVYNQLKSQHFQKMLRFRFNLLQQCNLKTVKKNYKKNKTRCVWVVKKHTGDPTFFGITTLKDRIFQHIITLGVLPISESQSDVLPFRLSSKKFIFQVIKYVFRKLSKNEVVIQRFPFKLLEVKKEHLDKSAKKKAEFKTSKAVVVTSKKQLAY